MMQNSENGENIFLNIFEDSFSLFMGKWSIIVGERRLYSRGKEAKNPIVGERGLYSRGKEAKKPIVGERRLYSRGSEAK